MTEAEIKEVITKQHRFFETGGTRNIEDRLNALKNLYKKLEKNEALIAQALKEDLGKSSDESYMCEIGLSMSEISWLEKHAAKLAGEKKERTPLSQAVSKSYRKPSPYGTVLIMSPWNYPILLSIDPLADAIAAGNTVVLKPSAYSPSSSDVLVKILGEVFPPEWVSVVTGGREENTALLDQKWDMIFFTGSQNVGKTVLSKAAKHLTPVTLELGGKSPCIVDETARIPLAAKRIVWGKYLNCGQTCVAPDYILCDAGIQDELVEELEKQIHLQFGEDPLSNPNYGRIINEKHFNRLSGLMDEEAKEIAKNGNGRMVGGRKNASTLQIEPTLITGCSFDDAIMQEEIFGPILPILTYDKAEHLPQIINSRPKPLACYIFSENKKRIQYLTEFCEFGGGCVNDCVIHLATPYMPFGGVGESGMGCYHGKEGFETFSHTKSIVDKKTFIDLPMRYQPYKPLYSKIIHRFVR